PSTFARTGTVTIAGRTFSVNQQRNVACSYSLSPSSANLQRFARSATVKVATGAGCGWSAVTNAEWITIDSGANGSGNGAVNYSVTALPRGTTQRTGTLTIAGRTVTVVQSR
ncbi:MAG TPA: BACON domain-containing carbohydrate-binding protein, partial [Casimicrobiaceae bacterium]|nr:BACON domain-containing carbohydrate-binding protein [Casimicrobiaceae bacterium]